MAVHFPYEIPQAKLQALEAAGISVTSRPRIGHLCHEKIWQGSLTSVWYPEKPRTPGHLVISFGVPTFAQVPPDAYNEMHLVIQKIYAALPNQGFVVCCQERQGEYLAEILPERPPANGVKNMADKLSSTHHMFSPENPLSDISYDFDVDEKEMDCRYWKAALSPPHRNMPAVEDTTGPWVLKSSHIEAATLMTRNNLKEILGGGISEGFEVLDWRAADKPSPIEEQQMGSCAFCRPEVLATQTIMESNGFRMLYNLAGGTRFLLIPDRHTARIADVENVTVMWEMEQKFRKMLQAEHPQWHVVTYCQDTPAVGQSIRHMHWQIISFDPETVAWDTRVECLRYMREGARKLSAEEMAERVAYYRGKLALVESRGLRRASSDRS